MNRNTYYILALIGSFVVHTCAMSQQAVGDVPNGDCSSASLVVEGIPAFEGDNALASNVDDDEASCSPSDRDVWFEYAAGCTGFATVDTFGSGQADTVLSVYDTCGGTELACNDDSGGLLSEVTFPVAMGVPYWIRLASIDLAGDYDLNISCNSVPDNDNCASATPVSDGVPAAEGDNAGAAADDAEASCGSSDDDVWFEYVATCTGDATVDTFGSGQGDTLLNAYDACSGNELDCDDDTGGLLSQIEFSVTMGQSYWIRVASIGLPGDYDLNISCASAPNNDDCVVAMIVTDGAPAAQGNNSGATADNVEATCTSSDNDVWFEYVATCTGNISADTFGSGQADTVLSLNDACGGTEIACNDDAGGSLSQISGAVTSGQSYWIRLASVGPPGDYALNVSCASVPTNDSCVDATGVTDGTPSWEGDNAGAATDDAEASCRDSDYDVWFKYDATCNGAATVDTFGSNQVDTVLSVYAACGGGEIACNDDTGGTLSEVSLAVTSGTSYWIRLASIGFAGDYDLNISCSSGPDNDSCATATIVTDGVPAAEGDNSGAGADDSEASCRLSDNDVWFEYVATCEGTVTVNTLGSGQEDTVLSVYDACDGNEVACNDDAGGTLSEVLLTATLGQPFWIRLASVSAAGDYDINISCSVVEPVPTASAWGVVVMAMLILTTGTLASRWRLDAVHQLNE